MDSLIIFVCALCLHLLTNCFACNFYGCDTCLDNGYCNLTCNQGYIGAACDACLPGYYAYNNGSMCSPCQKACSTCDGYFNCTGCIDGRYGESCQNICPHQCYQNKCHIDSGECIACIANSFGIYCDPCPSKCLNNQCNVNGECAQGCAIGYYGPNCTACSTGCKERQCYSDGTCSCDIGYTGSTCEMCQSEWYKHGDICISCSRECRDNDDGLCDNVSDICANVSDICENCGLFEEYDEPESSQGHTDTPVIVGICVGVSVLLIVAILLIVLYARKRKRCTQTQSHQHSSIEQDTEVKMVTATRTENEDVEGQDRPSRDNEDSDRRVIYEVVDSEPNQYEGLQNRDPPQASNEYQSLEMKEMSEYERLQNRDPPQAPNEYQSLEMKEMGLQPNAETSSRNEENKEYLNLKW